METKGIKQKLEELRKVGERLEAKKEEARGLREEIKNLNEKEDLIRKEVQTHLESSPELKEEDGSATVEFPDVGRATLTAPIDRLVVKDDDAVMDVLGADFIRVKRSLDMRKVKGFLKARNQVIDGVEKVREQQLRIQLFNK